MTTSVITLGAVALGGALGALSRFGVGSLAGRWLGSGFPWGTMACNIAGSIIMGVLIGLFAHYGTSNTVRLFLAVGFLGAFTTFSSFSLETILMLERGDYLPAVAYVVVSLAAGFAGLAGALLTMRYLLAAS